MLKNRQSFHCFTRQYLLRWFVFRICHAHVLALLSPLLQISHLCVFCDMRACFNCTQ